MKWFMMLLIFIGGIYYMVNKRSEGLLAEAERQKAVAEQQKKERIKAEPIPELPVKTEKFYVLKFSQQTLTTLRGLIIDPNENVRFAALELLWQLQDEEAPGLVKRMFMEEQEPEVKKMIIAMLAKDQNKVSLALLGEALNDYDKNIRIRAIEAISTFSTKDAITVLTRAMHDYDDDVRLKAIQAMTVVKRQIEQNKEQQMLQETQVKEPRFRVE